MKNRTKSSSSTTVHRGGSVYKKTTDPTTTKPTTDESNKENKKVIITDDINENEGFSGWLTSDEGSNTMKMFVMANSIVMLLTVAWPYLYQLMNYIHDYNTDRPMFSFQGIIILLIVVWYSLIILKNTNNYYKEAYQNHLVKENKKYGEQYMKQKIQQGSIDKDFKQTWNEKKSFADINNNNDYCYENDDVCLAEADDQNSERNVDETFIRYLKDYERL